MGCYGLGLSRILASSVEYLSSKVLECLELSKSSKKETGNSNSLHINTKLLNIRWPKVIVPFKICLILPKKDSKEDHNKGTEFSYHLAEVIQSRFNEDILIDDRSNLTIGKRLLTAKAIGIPIILVAGRNIINQIPQFELFNMYSQDLTNYNYNESNDSPMLFTQAEVLNYLEQNLRQFSHQNLT